jgi:hypothetical protein
MRHYQLLSNDSNLVAFKINPRAYKPRLILKGRPSDRPGITISGNYNWRSVPIGILEVDDMVVTTISKYDHLRPILVHDRDTDAWSIVGQKEYLKNGAHIDFAFQSGPTLIQNGEISVQSKEQKFRDDAIRSMTHQVALGIRADGKFIFVFAYGYTLDRLAKYLYDQGCVSAMKCDGGSCAFMQFIPDTNHKMPPLQVGNRGLLPVAIQFVYK